MLYEEGELYLIFKGFAFIYRKGLRLIDDSICIDTIFMLSSVYSIQIIYNNIEGNIFE